MVEQWTEAQVIEALTAADLDEGIPLIRRWLHRGDGVAVYENHDLNHSGLGHRQFLSYGSKQAQLETSEAPAQLPDIGPTINWRYQLIATCRRELYAAEPPKEG